jgi:ankyrin repeat protein
LLILTVPLSGTQDGLTALLAAACGEHSAVVKLLLESGASVNAVEKVGKQKCAVSFVLYFDKLVLLLLARQYLLHVAISISLYVIITIFTARAA